MKTRQGVQTFFYDFTPNIAIGYGVRSPNSEPERRTLGQGSNEFPGFPTVFGSLLLHLYKGHLNTLNSCQESSYSNVAHRLVAHRLATNIAALRSTFFNRT
ncbi:MAG: hypothetical protein AAF810_21095 [Cyanobacteria bacterium P01_D01_bin.36]